MLYLIYQANHIKFDYRNGQEPIVHMEADLRDSVAWAQQNNQRWVFTLSNAGAYYFEDRCDLAQLNEINWEALYTNRWSGNCIAPLVKEGKQAEFLMEYNFSWHFVERIGVYSREVYHQVANALPAGGHRPQIEIKPEWYY